MLPIPIDLGVRSRGAKNQVRVQTEQAVAPADLAPFDGFEQEIPAPFLDQFYRRTDRRFGVGNDLAPDEGRATCR